MTREDCVRDSRLIAARNFRKSSTARARCVPETDATSIGCWKSGSIVRAVRRFSATFVALAMVAAFSVAPAQERPQVRLNVSEAIDFALAHHPSLRSHSAIEEGTAARVSEARSAYFPRLDVSGQENRATGNVVSGSLFSMPGIPQVMGPPTGRRFD